MELGQREFVRVCKHVCTGAICYSSSCYFQSSSKAKLGCGTYRRARVRHLGQWVPVQPSWNGQKKDSWCNCLKSVFRFLAANSISFHPMCFIILNQLLYSNRFLIPSTLKDVTLYILEKISHQNASRRKYSLLRLCDSSSRQQRRPLVIFDRRTDCGGMGGSERLLRSRLDWLIDIWYVAR